jgi:hypothetical protein
MFWCNQCHRAAHYWSLLKLYFVKIVDYGTSVCSDVAAYISNVLVGLCMSQGSGVEPTSEQCDIRTPTRTH